MDLFDKSFIEKNDKILHVCICFMYTHIDYIHDFLGRFLIV